MRTCTLHFRSHWLKEMAISASLSPTHPALADLWSVGGGGGVHHTRVGWCTRIVCRRCLFTVWPASHRVVGFSSQFPWLVGLSQCTQCIRFGFVGIPQEGLST